MRPILDTNNLWYSEETLVFNSRANLVFKVFISVLTLVFSIYLVFNSQYLFSLVVFGVDCYLMKGIMKLFAEKDEVQLRINSNGIQIKNEPLLAWDTIQGETITTIKAGRTSVHDFIFYDSNHQVTKKFRVEKFNIDHQELLKSTAIHRARFNRKNNPS